MRRLRLFMLYLLFALGAHLLGPVLLGPARCVAELGRFDPKTGEGCESP